MPVTIVPLKRVRRGTTGTPLKGCVPLVPSHSALSMFPSGLMDPASVIPLLRNERARSGDRGSLYQEAQRQAGGAYTGAMTGCPRFQNQPANSGMMTR